MEYGARSRAKSDLDLWTLSCLCGPSWKKLKEKWPMCSREDTPMLIIVCWQFFLRGFNEDTFLLVLQ